MGVVETETAFGLSPSLAAELDRFLACLDIPFSSPMDRAMKIADATDNAVAKAALLPRIGDFTGSIAAHYDALARPRTGQHDRLILESLIQMLDREGETTVAEARAVRLEWWRRFGASVANPDRVLRNTRDPDRRIVLGVVSSNFKHSSAGNCLEAILFNFSEAVRVICYSTSTAGTAVDPRAVIFHSLLDVVDVSRLSEPALAARMRADGVDIALDGMGFTYGNRLAAFAERLAPIQITGLGYATGSIPAMDYILLDPITAGDDSFFEQVLHAPCVVSYLPPMDLVCPPVAPQPTGPVTFGAFHCFIKISAAYLTACRRILDRVPGSRIVFKGKEYGEAELQHRIVTALGDRCEFWPTTQQMAHFDAFKHVDFVLDPWPQTGGITTCEALYMGVPSVTLAGERTIQRACAAILAAVDCHDGITTTVDDYVERAVEWATTSRDWLAEQRPYWRPRLMASAVIRGYVPALEALLRSVWRAWCAEGV